jgi:hypothetical protein
LLADQRSRFCRRIATTIICREILFRLARSTVPGFRAVLLHRERPGAPGDEQKLLQCGDCSPKRFHIIRDDILMEAIGVASKQNPSVDFVDKLLECG